MDINEKTIVLITVGVVLGLIFLLLLLRTIFRAVQQKLAALIADKFSPDEIILSTTRANLFGLESRGRAQLRGNGALVLTRDKLYYIMAVAGTEFEIPLERVRDVSFPKTFLGKSIFRPLFCVEFTAPDGAEDRIAWYVSDPEQWGEAVTATGKKRTV